LWNFLETQRKVTVELLLEGAGGGKAEVLSQLLTSLTWLHFCHLNTNLSLTKQHNFQPNHHHASQQPWIRRSSQTPYRRACTSFAAHSSAG
jgi:hypothetical protein